MALGHLIRSLVERSLYSVGTLDAMTADELIAHEAEAKEAIETMHKLVTRVEEYAEYVSIVTAKAVEDQILAERKG